MTPTFIQHPTHYTLAEFRTMLAGVELGAWRPRFPTLHNTGVPSLKQWLAYGPTPQERWGASLNRYYEGLGWHAGPHLVVCPDYVWVLCDLTKSGVSVSCWNSETFGIEMIGNYEVGGDDFSGGDGANVRDNAAAVLALLCQIFKWPDLADFAPGVKGLHLPPRMHPGSSRLPGLEGEQAGHARAHRRHGGRVCRSSRASHAAGAHRAANWTDAA
jgi:hypothetical protein